MGLVRKQEESMKRQTTLGKHKELKKKEKSLKNMV